MIIQRRSNEAKEKRSKEIIEGMKERIEKCKNGVGNKRKRKLNSSIEKTK